VIPHPFRALLLSAGLALRAASPAMVAEALRQPADAARFPQAGAVVLLDETVITLDARGRATREGHRLVKILQDRALRQLSDQKIAFRGDTETCAVLAARTLLPSGEAREPEASGVMEVSDPEAAAAPFYSSARLKVISYPAVQIGAVLELQYRISPRPDAVAGPEPDPFAGDWAFGGPEPVLSASLALEVPTGAGLKYQMINGAPEPAVRTGAGATRCTWTLKDQPQVVPEAGMVPGDAFLPRVVWTVVPDRAQLGRWLHGRFQAAAEPGPAVRAKAAELTAGLADPAAKAERLALFVTKDIQNVALSLGRVGWRPTPAATILANRYADGRDKVVLFQSLLRAAGLEAEPVLIRQVRAGISGLACLDEYDELLARVPLPGGERLYNLARNRAMLGRLVADDAGRPALRVTAAGGVETTTPPVDERSQFIRARWDMALDDAGALAGRITLDYAGLFDQQIRRQLFGRNRSDREVLFQAAVDRIRKGARLVGFEVSDLLDLSRPARVVLEVAVPAFACRQGDMMILNLPADYLPLGEPPVQPQLPAMKHPFLAPATCALEATLDLKLPAGYKVAYRPPAADLRREPFAFSLAVASRPDGLELRRTVRWREAVVDPAQYPALWRACGQTTAPGNHLILLER
jgi:hypothetical protein